MMIAKYFLLENTTHVNIHNIAPSQSSDKLTCIGAEASLTTISEPHGSIGTTACLASGRVNASVVPTKANHNGPTALLVIEGFKIGGDISNGRHFVSHEDVRFGAVVSCVNE